MPNFRGAAAAGFSGLAMIAAAVAGGSPAAATEPAVPPAATSSAVQAEAAEQRDITQPPWKVHSTHRTLNACQLAGKLLMSTGSARQTSCVPFFGTWRLMYR